MFSASLLFVYGMKTVCLNFSFDKKNIPELWLDWFIAIKLRFRYVPVLVMNTN